MSKTIGGFLAIRNGRSLDYCYDLAIQSMLPICDQIVVADADSDDGTKEHLEEWARSESKLRIINYPWPDPKGDPEAYPSWINRARQELTTDMAIYLDGDEIFDPSGFDRIRYASKHGESLYCKRLNYWRDAQSLIPEGHCCGTKVIRVGPQRLFFPSDYPIERAAEIQSKAISAPDVLIHHYGFLRQRDAFFRKARAVSRIWAGADSFDPRLVAAEQQDGNWMANHKVSEWIDRLVPFTGQHPLLIRPWLRERGFWTDTESLIAKWKPVIDRTKEIFTWTGDGELAYVAEQASTASSAIEVGSYMGRSAKVMLLANPKLHLWCVDSFQVAGTKECCQHFLKEEIGSGRCELITGSSPAAADMLKHMAGQIDTVWIDAGHSTSEVMIDIEQMLPLLRRGGRLFGHDYDGDNDVAVGVQRSLQNFQVPVSRVWSYVKP